MDDDAAGRLWQFHIGLAEIRDQDVDLMAKERKLASEIAPAQRARRLRGRIVVSDEEDAHARARLSAGALARLPGRGWTPLR